MPVNENSLINRTLLVGITWCNVKDEVIEQEQFFGKVTKIRENQGGIEIELLNGVWYLMPPYFPTILHAPRGEYLCVSSGEKVINPDFLTSWRAVKIEDSELSDWQPNYAPLIESIVPKEWEFTYHHDQEHIAKTLPLLAEDFIGKHILIGVSVYLSEDENEKLAERKQFYGQILRVNLAEGVVISLSTGEEIKLPPDLTLIQPAPPGEYTLRSTGEVVIDPDYITRWNRISKKETIVGE